MKLFRAATFAFGLLVIAAELFRSWNDRPVIFWLDDFMVGAALIAAAWLASPETARSRAALCAAWGFAAGIIYISFFDKVVLAEAVGPGVEINPLNIFVTLSLAAAVAGLAASLLLPFKSSP